MGPGQVVAKGSVLGGLSPGRADWFSLPVVQCIRQGLWVPLGRRLAVGSMPAWPRRGRAGVGVGRAQGCAVPGRSHRRDEAEELVFQCNSVHTGGQWLLTRIKEAGGSEAAGLPRGGAGGLGGGQGCWARTQFQSRSASDPATVATHKALGSRTCGLGAGRLARRVGARNWGLKPGVGKRHMGSGVCGGGPEGGCTRRVRHGDLSEPSPAGSPFARPGLKSGRTESASYLRRKEKKFRFLVRRVVKAQSFYWAVLCVVALNTLCVAMVHHKQPQRLTTALCT